MFEYEEVPIGICTLNKISPFKLCEKAELPRRTTHCLRVTCASRLFQNSVEEKLIRERTGHKSDALFLYEKGSKTQLMTRMAKWRGWVGRGSCVVGRGSCVVGRASWVVRRGSWVVRRGSWVRCWASYRQ